MTFSIIGTGNMAWFLAKRLTQAGYTCTSVYGRDTRAASELAAEVKGAVAGNITDIRDNLIILAVSDNALADLAAQLSPDNDQTLLIHTAGSVGINVLSQAAAYGVIWPVYSILKTDLPVTRNIPCAIEAGSPATLLRVRELAATFSDNIFEAGEQQRRWLHLAAVTANNFINHLMTIAESICLRQGLPFSVLQPMLEQTFQRIRSASPADMQTGPASRNDTATIGRHLNLLSDDPAWQAVYRTITESIMLSNGIHPKQS